MQFVSGMLYFLFSSMKFSLLIVQVLIGLKIISLGGFMMHLFEPSVQ